MSNSSTKLGKVIQIDEEQVKEHLGEIVRGTVEETLNNMLNAEADRLCKAKRYERTPDQSTPEPATTSAACTSFGARRCSRSRAS